MSPRRLLPLLLAAAAGGCTGLTQNPSYFPFYLPTGDVEPTHAKPPGLGYFRNFDPKACKLEVTPTARTVPTRSQVVLIASVNDRDGVPRRKRRVEWMLDGPGHIIEVDESGYLPGRGYKQTDRFAVSYTDYFEHTFTRGNDDPRDDFTIRPGQTWCVVSSAVEGQTKVTVYAPEVFDWDNGRQFVTLTWQDGGFTARSPEKAGGGRPPPAAATSVSETRRQHGADAPRPPGSGKPVAKLEVEPAAGSVGEPVPVRVTVANTGTGPIENAVVWVDAPGTTVETPEVSVGRVDPGDRRTVTATVTADRPGTLPVRVNLTADGGLSVRGEGKATVSRTELGVTITGPKALAVGEDAVFDVVLTNPGDVPLRNATATARVPAGLTVRSGGDDGRVTGNTAEWKVAALPAGGSTTLRLVLTGDRLLDSGAVRVSASADRPGGGRPLETAGSATVAVTGRPAVTLELTPPAGPVTVGGRAVYRATVRNRGTAPATGLEAVMTFGSELRPTAGNGGRASGQAVTFRVPDGLPPNETAVFTVEAEAVSAGDARVTAEVRGRDLPQPLREEQPTRVTGRR